MEQQQSWVPYSSKDECSSCSIYCPQWCYGVFPPPPPLDADPPNSAFSPLVISLVGVIASIVLLISYYTIISKYCASNTTHRNQEANLNHEMWNAAVVSEGLDDAAIKSITTRRYRKGGDGDGSSSTDCTVCLTEFREDDVVRLLPNCSHSFHVHCIDTWLKSHSNCPLCRCKVLPQLRTTMHWPEQQMAMVVDHQPPPRTDQLGRAIMAEAKERRSRSWCRRKVSIADVLEKDDDDEGGSNADASTIAGSSTVVEDEVHHHHNNRERCWQIPISTSMNEKDLQRYPCEHKEEDENRRKNEGQYVIPV